VDVYKTEDEQLESLKRWMRDNGRNALTAVLVAVLVVVGAYSWKQRELRLQETASLEYQGLADAVRQLEQQPNPNKELATTAQHIADMLKTEYPNTTYAKFAALFKAKLAVRDNDLVQAESELRWVLDRKPTPELAALTKLRLARVLHAKGDDDAALALLDDASAGSYAFTYEQLKGDIALARGDSNAARAAYEKAQELERKLQVPVNDPLLEIKLRDLEGGAAAAPKAAPEQQSTPEKQES
jgi:predicted negative regulator of RcsB-dependent stress response